MHPVLLFRLSVILPPVLSGIAVAYAVFAEDSFPQEWRDLMAWNGDGGVLPDDLRDAAWPVWIVVGAVGLVALIALVNQILLLFYWKPSRYLYLATCCLAYPAMLLFGLSILTPLEEVLYEVSTFLSGVALALAFYSPVADRFR